MSMYKVLKTGLTLWFCGVVAFMKQCGGIHRPVQHLKKNASRTFECLEANVVRRSSGKMLKHSAVSHSSVIQSTVCILTAKKTDEDTKHATHRSTKYFQWYIEKWMKYNILSSQSGHKIFLLSFFFLFFLKVDTRIMFPKHHVLLLKISWHISAVGIQYSLDSPISIIALAHLPIYNLHLELPNPFFQFFPVPLGEGEVSILGEERRGEGNHWEWLGVGSQAAGCGLGGLYLLSQLVKAVALLIHFWDRCNFVSWSELQTFDWSFGPE